MPNRILKESICASDTIDQLSAEEERFFYRLIVNCDDYGRLDARPSVVRSKLFPLKLDEIHDIDVIKLLATLVLTKLITVYSDDKNRYFLQLATWEKHQQIRAKKSKYPVYNSESHHLLNPDNICNQMISDFKCNQLISNVPVIQSNPIQSNPNPCSVPAIEIAATPEKRVKPLLVKKVKTYGQFKNIFLTDEDYQKLEEKFNSKLPALIEKVSTGIATHGYKYKNFYAAILNWVRMDEERGITHGTDRQTIPGNRPGGAFAGLDQT